MKRTYYFKKFSSFDYYSTWNGYDEEERQEWSTKTLPAKRAAFLWKSILKERPELVTEYEAQFNPSARYQLYVEYGTHTGYKSVLRAYRVIPWNQVRKLDESHRREPRTL